MIVKIHKTPDKRKVVAICDNELIGQKFEEGKLQLDLSSDFYKGEDKSEEEVLELIKGSYIINVVGEKSIGFCLKLKILNETDIIKIKNIPHAQAVMG
jgi:uncharacterized protein